MGAFDAFPIVQPAQASQPGAAPAAPLQAQPASSPQPAPPGADPWAQFPIVQPRGQGTAPQAPQQPQSGAPAGQPASPPAPTQPEGLLGGAERVAGDVWRGIGQGAHAINSWLNPVVDASDPTLGVATRLGSNLAAGVSQVTPGLTPMTEAQSYAATMRRQTEEAQQSPMLSLAGEAMGMLTGGEAMAGGMGELAKSAGMVGDVARAMQPVAGQPIRNALRMGAAGAGMGAVQQEAQNNQIIPDTNTAGAALVGGITAPILGGAIGAGMRGVTNLAMDRGWNVLARALGTTGDKMAAAADSARMLTGEEPSAAMLFKGQDAATIKQLAEINPILGQALIEHNKAIMGEAPASVQGLIEGNAGPLPSQSSPDMVKAFGAQIPESGQIQPAIKTLGDKLIEPIRNNPVSLNADQLSLLTKPGIISALKGAAKWSPDNAADAPLILKKLKTMVEAFTGPDGKPIPGMTSDILNVGDIDKIRRIVGDVAQTDKNKPFTKAISKLRDSIGDLAGTQYTSAISRLNAAHDFRRGFEHAFAGNGIRDAATGAEAGLTSESLKTPSGRAGYAAGLGRRLMNQAGEGPVAASGVANTLADTGASTSNLGNAIGPLRAGNVQNVMQEKAGQLNTLNQITPKSLPPHSELPLHDAAVAVGESAAGMHGVGMARGGRFLASVFNTNKLSDKAQLKLADYLTSRDPVKLKQGLAMLEKVGKTRQQIKEITQALGGMSGAGIGAMTGTPQSVYNGQ